jgi:uncharacterized protein YjbJ (UPF0337 family)
MEAGWKQMKGNARAQWGRLNDEPTDVIAGEHEHLIGPVQEQRVFGKQEDGKPADEVASASKKNDFKEVTKGAQS